MHELSIAISMIDVACEELARQGGGRVASLHLRLGPLSGVMKEALLSAWELACEQSPLEGSTLIIEDVPIEIDCPYCGSPQQVISIQDMTCRRCGHPSANIIHGRELELFAMEICDEQTAPAC